MSNYELSIPGTLFATGVMATGLILGPGHGEVPEVRFPTHSVESVTTVDQVGDWQGTTPATGPAEWRTFLNSTFTPDLQTRTNFDAGAYEGSGFEWDALKRGIAAGSGTNDPARAHYEVTANAPAGPGVTPEQDKANDLQLAEKAAADIRNVLPGVTVTAEAVDALKPDEYDQWDPGDEEGVRVTGVLDFGSKVKYTGCERTADLTRVETTNDSAVGIHYLAPVPVIRRRKEQTGDDDTSEQVATDSTSQETASVSDAVGSREQSAVVAVADDGFDGGADLQRRPAARRRLPVTLPSLPSLRLPNIELPRLDLSERGWRIGRAVL
ncbi:MAG: hypothetical protein ABWY71_01280, partial [Candidatus Saccharimonadales bacterium]